MQEKELENELEKKDKIRKDLTLFSKIYENVLNAEDYEAFESLRTKFKQVKQWNLETVDQSCMIYSSKDLNQLIDEKSQLFNSKNSVKHNSKAEELFSKTLDSNKKISTVLLLVLLYILMSYWGFSLMSNITLCLMLPISLMFIGSISHFELEKTPACKSIENKSSFFKVNAKIFCHPDDIAFALCKPSHRLNWDMNLVKIDNEDDNLSKLMKIQYESYQGGKFTETHKYSFYKEDDDLMYIIEQNQMDLFSQAPFSRLFEFKHQVDKNENVYYSLTVFGESLPFILNHKAPTFVLDSIKSLTVYTSICPSLPSTEVPLHERKTSLPERDGKIWIKYRKRTGEDLEQISESAEFDDGVEEYKISEYNMKDTLLTVDAFDEGESNDCGEDMHEDELYSEVDRLLRTESDDLTNIKMEALAFDNGHVNGKLIKNCSQNTESDGDHSYVVFDTRNDNTLASDKDSNGAVVSPCKDAKIPNPSLGVSTIDPILKPQNNLGDVVKNLYSKPL